MATKIAKSEYVPGEYIAKRYEVKRAIGKGGMGMVYLVVDHKTGEPMALKTIRPEYTTSSYALHRFGREVRTIRKLNHPGIVRIRDAFRYGRLVFYTMDYVEGQSVRELIQQRRRLGLGSTVRILALVAHALEHAHNCTIHRDMSPENIMVLSDGSIRLLDFGLAKLTDTEPTFTRIGVTLGKHQYISPEQLLSSAEVDCRTDIYALGIIFHEMLTGRLPEKEKAITDWVPTLPASCNAFFEKATARNPDDRFATAEEFRGAIIDLFRAYRRDQDEPVAAVASPSCASRPGLWARLRSWLRRWWRREKKVTA